MVMHLIHVPDSILAVMHIENGFHLLKVHSNAFFRHRVVAVYGCCLSTTQRKTLVALL